jgi:hypothetical protein
MILWLLILAIMMLSFSAFFAAYLAVFYTTSFKIATFAKATSMALGFAGIVMLFIAIDWWWGLAGIVGYWLLIVLSMVFWHGRFATLVARGEDLWASGRDS